MKGIPPEIDRLMWSVAENATDSALDEFSVRYPEHRLELLRRARMVSQLKSAGKASHETVVPSFHLRQNVEVTRSPRAMAITGGIVLAAIACASYAVMLVIQPAPAPVVKSNVNLAPLEQAFPKVEYTNSIKPKDSVPAPVEEPKPPVPNRVPLDAGNEALPGYLKPQDVSIKSMPLTSALSLITAGTGLELEVAPGFDNPTVSMDYHQKTPIDVLKDLSRQYAFTLLDEGNHRYLAVPVADPAVVDGTKHGRVSP